MKNQKIFDAMVEKGINDIVGGGDPVAIGNKNVETLAHFTDLKEGLRVLDFGCGCGRVALPLLDIIGESGHLVGVDIIPELVDFCRAEISSEYKNTEFYQLIADNSHYTDWTSTQDKSKSVINDLSQVKGEGFDLIFAFSVFTHLDLADTKKYLEALSQLLKPNGSLVISVLLINESSRAWMRDGNPNVPFNKSVLLKNKKIYFGNRADKLAAVGFSEANLIGYAQHSGLDVVQICYGNWPGRSNSLNGQDVIGFKPMAKLPKGFDAKKYIQMHPDLTWDAETEEGRQSARQHFLRHGFFEGRAWR